MCNVMQLVCVQYVVLGLDDVCDHLTFAFDKDLAATLARIAVHLIYGAQLVGHLQIEQTINR